MFKIEHAIDVELTEHVFGDHSFMFHDINELSVFWEWLEDGLLPVTVKQVGVRVLSRCGVRVVTVPAVSHSCSMRLRRMLWATPSVTTSGGTWRNTTELSEEYDSSNTGRRRSHVRSTYWTSSTAHATLKTPPVRELAWLGFSDTSETHARASH